MAQMWERVRKNSKKFLIYTWVLYTFLFLCFAIPFSIHLGWARGG